MDERIIKAAKASGLKLNAAELAKINELSLRELTEEEVYAFKVAICDNEVDRDNEVFPLEALKELAECFIGKTVISDHMWKSGNQVARIYATEVISGIGTTKNGEQYNQLIAHCYMLRTESNKDLIAEIDAGIKKEVSVGCKMASAICNICGADNRKTWCDHYPGKTYDGKYCFFLLKNAKDAYELSFVAVPAQPNAGVTKSYGAQKPKDQEEEQKQVNTETQDLTLRFKLLDSFIFTEKEKKENE